MMTSPLNNNTYNDPVTHTHTHTHTHTNQRYIDIPFTHPIHRLFLCLALSSGLTRGYSQTLYTCWGASSYSVSVLGVLRLCYEYSYNDSGALVGTFIRVYKKNWVNRRGAAK